MNSLEVEDAWLYAYSPSGDPNEHYVTKGWNWGAHTVPPDQAVHDRETRTTNKSPPHIGVGSIESTSQPGWSHAEQMLHTRARVFQP